jgi:hypothetical protein
MPEPLTDLDDAVRTAFVYLSEVDVLDAEPYDAVIGFGMFDLTLPRFCGDLYTRGRARRIVFTGGIGAGTGDLGAPEADVWRGRSRLRIHQLVTMSSSSRTSPRTQARMWRSRRRCWSAFGPN